MTGPAEALGLLAGAGQGWLIAAALVFLRVGAVMAFLPGFGDQVVPMRIRLGLTLAFTAIVLPAVGDRMPTDSPLAAGVCEIAAGLLLGAALRLAYLALHTAGAIAAQSASLAQMFSGAGAEPQPAIGHVLTMAGLALAMASGLHVKAAAMMIASYDLLPAGHLPAPDEAARWATGAATQSFGLAFSLAAPFVLASILYNLAIGAINRAMPQLMVSFIGAPAMTAGGLAILALAAVPALEVWRTAFETVLSTPFGPAP